MSKCSFQEEEGFLVCSWPSSVIERWLLDICHFMWKTKPRAVILVFCEWQPPFFFILLILSENLMVNKTFIWDPWLCAECMYVQENSPMVIQVEIKGFYHSLSSFPWLKSKMFTYCFKQLFQITVCVVTWEGEDFIRWWNVVLNKACVCQFIAVTYYVPSKLGALFWVLGRYRTFMK